MAKEKVVKDITNENVIEALSQVIEAQQGVIKVLGELLAAERTKNAICVPTIFTTPNSTQPYTPTLPGTGTFPTLYKPYIGDPLPGKQGTWISGTADGYKSVQNAKLANSAGIGEA